jgi:signal transduction histidine kinase
LLFVEDDIGKRYVIARQLRAAGFEIDEAATGEQALAMVSPRHEVAILDIKLPDMMGWDLCKRIKEMPETAGIKVLELSATLAAAEDRARGLDLGADCYLVHPVELVELVAALRSLIRLRKAERDRARAQELFLASLSHDLRNPLSTLGMGLQILAASPAVDLVTIDRMSRTVDRMKRMIEQLLVFTQSMSEPVPITRQHVDLAELCRTVMRDAQQKTERPLELDLEQPIELSGDPDKITQIIDNLVSNAIRHGEGTVSVRVCRVGQHALIAIHNTGTPIAPHLMERLFEPFARAGGAEGGVGLGLYIVDELVRAHGGRVEVSSTAEAGTTFTVQLPL